MGAQMKSVFLIAALAALVGLILGFTLGAAVLPRTPTPSNSGFRGPTGVPSVRGPGGPPLKSVQFLQAL